MMKQESSNELALRPREEGAGHLVTENVDYYRGYAEGKVVKGRREEEVLSELGSPALIVRSILDAAGYWVDDVPDQNPDGSLGKDAGSYYRIRNEEKERREDRNIRVEMRQVNSWITGILSLLFVVLLILAVLGFISFIIWAAPIVLALLLLSFIYHTLMQLFQR